METEYKVATVCFSFFNLNCVIFAFLVYLPKIHTMKQMNSYVWKLWEYVEFSVFGSRSI